MYSYVLVADAGRDAACAIAAATGAGDGAGPTGVTPLGPDGAITDTAVAAAGGVGGKGDTAGGNFFFGIRIPTYLKPPNYDINQHISEEILHEPGREPAIDDIIILPFRHISFYSPPS
jgi:hypothetical protein